MGKSAEVTLRALYKNAEVSDLLWGSDPAETTVALWSVNNTSSHPLEWHYGHETFQADDGYQYELDQSHQINHLDLPARWINALQAELEASARQNVITLIETPPATSTLTHIDIELAIDRNGARETESYAFGFTPDFIQDGPTINNEFLENL